MSRSRWIPAAVLAALGLGACVEMPTQPSVAVMPGPYKPFEVFQTDDQVCRNYATVQIGGKTTGGTVNQSVASGAVAGTVLGAAAGALMGQNAVGAGIGAGAGLLIGSSMGSDSGDRSAYGLQRRYDIAYEQCMYAKGNQIPGYAAPAPMPPPGTTAQPPPPPPVPPRP